MARKANNAVKPNNTVVEEQNKKKDFVCKTCVRRDICREFTICKTCTKNQPIKEVETRVKAPSLKVFGLRTDEILPIEPAFIAVDSTGIKFFTRRPYFKYDDSYNTSGRWTTGCYEDQIACLRYDYLDGLFDTTKYRRGFRYDFEHMISPL